MQRLIYPNIDLKSVNEDFFETFLKFCSETEDNLNAVKHIEYGKVYQRLKECYVHALKVKSKNILFSDVLNALECLEEIPDFVKETFPDLSLEELQSVLRITTVILLIFERKI